MDTSTLQALKLGIISATGLSRDALHTYVGLALLIAASCITRKSLVPSAVGWWYWRGLASSSCSILWMIRRAWDTGGGARASMTSPIHCSGQRCWSWPIVSG